MSDTMLKGLFPAEANAEDIDVVSARIDEIIEDWVKSGEAGGSAAEAVRRIFMRCVTLDAEASAHFDHGRTLFLTSLANKNLEEAQYALLGLREVLLPGVMNTDAISLDTLESYHERNSDFQRIVSETDELREIFYANYIKAKEASGLRTQEDVARAAQINRGTVVSIERHRVLPRMETARRIASAFGVPLESLWPTRVNRSAVSVVKSAARSTAIV